VKTSLILSATLSLAACPAPDDDTDGAPAPTFTEIQEDIFDLSCTASSCHSATGRRGDLVLESDESYDNLLDVIPANTAAADDGWVLVEAGNAENSFLAAKCETPVATEYDGSMPLGGDGLEPDRLQALVEWIEAGALND